MPINSAVISGAFGLGSNILTNIGANKRESDARFFNMQMERNRRNYDQRMWSKVTKYNHPLQQMARLAEAGLNPNLIYGSSPGSAVGNAQSIASGKQVTGQAPAYQIDNAMVPFMDAKVKQAQANNMNTSAMKNIAGANLSDSQSNRINSLLASEVTTAEEGAKKSTIDRKKAEIELLAMNHREKGLVARYLAETEIAMNNSDLTEAKKGLANLENTMAQNGYRPNDPWTLRVIGTLLGLDFSKPLTKKHAEMVRDFMRDPRNFFMNYDIN